MRDRSGAFLKSGSLEWIKHERRKYAAFKEYLKTFPEEFQGLFDLSTSEEMRKVLREIKDLPRDTDEARAITLWNQIIAIHHREIRIYEEIRAYRQSLYRLAEVGENIEQYLGNVLDVTLGVLLVEFAYLDEAGKIRRQPNRFAEAVEGVEVSRIRACLVCKKLFWAQRKDRRCCSEEHSRIIRKRQSRQNKIEKAKIYATSAKRKKQKRKGGAIAKTAERHDPKGE